ncbi:hypothetical protein B484DRAFT_102333 [Ochromonadaceae sp. CCMP2298]|nr:hypothetical protein B484DRAFT_102333 [Ochromonadaceae sp. CCMP2298]
MALALLLLVAAALLGKSFANVFPYITGTLTNTNNALQNTVPVQQTACPGDILFFSTCSQYTGDPYIRLYFNGANVASNDDSVSGACSQISYTYSAAACSFLVLQLGCYSSGSCSMTATVAFTSAAPSALPSAQPSRPTLAPSAQPSRPTLAPSAQPSFRPTLAPSSVAPSAMNVFPYTTGDLTNTDDALQNTVPVSKVACPGDILQFSTCSQYSGNPYIRLYLNGVGVTSNDNSSPSPECLCPNTRPAAPCTTKLCRYNQPRHQRD